jgi:sugar/nucleoside kinase (ribokinase family)
VATVYVFGTMAADVMIGVRSMPETGAHVNGAYLGWRPGGGSANIACALSGAGHDVRLVGPAGTDPLGRALLAAVAAHGVGTEHVIPVPAAPRTLVFVDAAGERTILALAADGWPDRLDLPELSDLPGLAAADCVWVESYAAYPRDLAAVAAGAMIVTPPPDEPSLAGPADVIVGSTTQLPAAWRAAPLASARAAAGDRLRLLVVTGGDKGATAYTDQGARTVKAQPVAQVDATGAGDGFAAGLLHGLLAGEPLDAAMALGAAWGAATAQRPQSVPPPIEEVLRATAAADRAAADGDRPAGA